jgi:tRNA U38,U39,U40 pseudouridine synthase TruA
MVRAIVGTLLDIGRHKLDLEDMRNIILSHDRRKAGVSVAAKGLILWEVVYPDEIFCEVPVWFSYDNLKEIISHDNTDPKFHQGSGNETDE